MAFRYGGVSFPLDPASANSLLQDADPAVFQGLAFIASVIQTYVGARLVAEAAACGAPISQPVACTLPYEPGPYLMMEQMPLPALFLFRRTATNDYKTLTRSHEKGVLELDYVLPALSPAQAEHLLPIRHAIRLLLASCIERGFDDAYAPPGGQLGDDVWKAAGIERVDMNEVTYAGFVGVGDLYLPAIATTIAIQERNTGDDGTPLTGASAAVSVVADDGTTVTPPIVDTDTQLTPP